MQPTMTLVNWNVWWATPGSSRGRRVMEILAADSPDIVVLTEGQRDLLPMHGHVVEAGDDWGYPVINRARRKVLMWSLHPWTDVDQVGSESLPPGRWVAATTSIDLGLIRIAAVCIPWAHAHVGGGRRDKAPWEDHVDYCVKLDRLLQNSPRPHLVVGDFNQRLPRFRQPLRAHTALSTALNGLHVATAGATAHGQLIDHIAHDPTLRCEVRRLVPTHEENLGLSDHVGVVADVWLER